MQRELQLRAFVSRQFRRSGKIPDAFRVANIKRYEVVKKIQRDGERTKALVDKEGLQTKVNREFP